jgi:hypothetical protein
VATASSFVEAVSSSSLMVISELGAILSADLIKLMGFAKAKVTVKSCSSSGVG